MPSDNAPETGKVRHENIVVSKRLVAINSASSVLAKIINVTAILWVYQYLLKRIPAEEFAVLPVVTAIMVFAPLFFSFFTGGISRYVVEAYAQGDLEKVTGIVSSIFPLLAGAAGIFLAAGLTFALNIEDILNIIPQMVDEAQIMMALLVISFALEMLTVPFRTGYFVRQRFVELSFLGVARDMLRVTLMFILLVGVGPQVVWVVVATVTATTAYTVVVMIRSVRMVPQLRFRSSLYRGRQARELFSFGLWTTLGRLGGVMYTNAATIILNLYGSAVDVTAYHLGSTVFRQLDSMILLAAQPLQPVLTAMHALDNQQRLGRTVFRGGRYALWAAMAVATPLIIYADDFIDLYLGDAAYSSASVVIVLFMIIYPFSKPNALLSMTAMATAQVRIFFLPAVLFQLAGLILMYWLAAHRDMGAVGVTMSLTLITVVSQLTYFWPLAMKFTGFSFWDFLGKVLIPGLAPALAGAVIWGSLKILAPPHSWAGLFTISIAGGGVYLFVLFGACLNPSERADLRAALARVRAGIA